MKAALNFPEPELIIVQARIDDPEHGVKGTMVREVRPGGSYFGWSYDYLRSLGAGTHELDEGRRTFKAGTAR